MFQRVLAIAAAISGLGTVHGRGVSPYLPLDLAPEIERQIERVMTLADRPVMSRPIAAATVLDALPAACARDPVVCTDVRRYLSGFMKTVGLSHASLAVGADSGAVVALPNRRGMPSDSGYEVSASAYWQPSDHFLVSAGVLAYEDETQPVGSMLSAGFEYAQLDVGFRDHWFSPMSESAMLIATQAETMPSVTLSNYTPLTRFNLQYEFFLAEMSDSDRIRFGDGFTSGNPRLAGLHVSIQPFPGWSIAINRVMQFGGGERGGNSLRDIAEAFFDPSGKDNFGGDLSRDEELGNQAASITSRFIFQGETPFSVYFEYAGEDTSTLSNVRLGNVSLSAGIHFPAVGHGLELTFEASEWQNGWYVHGIYLDGLRNEGNVIGHWGGDWRVPNDGIGARSVMARIGWQPHLGGWVEATFRSIENQSHSTPDYDRAHMLDLIYSRRWKEFRVGAELGAGNDIFGESYSRLSGFIRF